MTDAEYLEIMGLKALVESLAVAEKSRFIAQEHAAKIFKGYLKITHIEKKGGVSKIC